MKTVEVAAGAIVSAGRLFATRRGYGPWAGWWEFPGGKVEPGESAEEALRRELREELHLEVELHERMATVDYYYPDFHLHMHLFLCTPCGSPVLTEHSAARWLDTDGLRTVDWLPADETVIPALAAMLSASM